MLHWPADSHRWSFDPDRRYGRRRPSDKPDGLWLSPVAARWGWADCAEFNQMADRLPLPPPVRFAVDVSRLLVLRSHRDVPERFRWSPSDAELAELSRRMPGQDWSRALAGVRWDAMAAEGFAGVVTDGWSARIGDDPAWWYRWDCDAAVVWDLSAVRLTEMPVRSRLAQ